MINKEVRIHKWFLFLYIYVFIFVLCPLHALEANVQVLSLDKKKLAIAFDDESIHIYSLKTGKVLQKLHGHKASIETLNFNSDSTKLISGDWEDTAIIWDLKTGKELRRRKFSSTIMHAYFSADDQYIILSEDEKKLAIYDRALFLKRKSFLIGHRLQISNNKEFIAGQGALDNVLVINVNTREIVMDIPVDSYDDQMYFSDDNHILVIRDFSDFHVWDIKNKKKIDTISSSIGADTATLNSARDELWIGSNNALEIWDYKRKKQKVIIKLLELDIDEVEHIDFSEDGTTLSICVTTNTHGNKVIFMDATTFTIKSVISPLSKLAYSSQFIDNTHLLLDSRYPVEVWDIKNNRKLFSFTKSGSDTNLTMQNIINTESKPYTISGRINGIDINKNSELIVTGTGMHNTLIFNAKGKIIKIFQNKYSTGYDARYSPDGQLAAFAYHGEHLLVYDTRSRNLDKEYTLGNVPNGTRIIKFSRDGKYLAAGSDGNSLSIIDTDKKKIIDREKFPGPIYALQWIDNDKLLVGTLQELYELDVKTKKRKTILDFGVTALDAYMIDNKVQFIAVGGYKEPLTLLNKEYKVINTFLHTEVSRVAIGKEGKTMVSTSEDTTYVWNILKKEAKLCAYEDENIWAMAYDKEKHLIYTAGDSGLVNVWDESCNAIKP